MKAIIKRAIILILMLIAFFALSHFLDSNTAFHLNQEYYCAEYGEC